MVSRNVPRNEESRNLSGGIAEVLKNPGLSPRRRIKFLKSISAPLDGPERHAMLVAIENDTPPPETAQEAWYAIVDELLATLRRQGADTGELAGRLALIYRNPSVNPVVRDYVLQHLGHIAAESGDPGGVGRLLESAVEEKQSGVAGTALLALNQLDADVRSAASSVARDPSYDLRSRITALQVAGKQHDAQILPFAVKTAGDPNAPVPLRISAIATIADLGASAQQSLLETLGQSADGRIRTAASSALARLAANPDNTR